ncbi:MAG: minor capsid protein [Ruminococcus sp.]|nr:minor capsid protein [Ruminococcus sp.]
MMRFTGITFDPNFQRNAERQFTMAQKCIDSEALRRSDPYVPFRTGMMKKSGISGTVIGSGVIEYTAPYAKPQYYLNRGFGKEGREPQKRHKRSERRIFLRPHESRPQR